MTLGVVEPEVQEEDRLDSYRLSTLRPGSLFAWDAQSSSLPCFCMPPSCTNCLWSVLLD